MVAAVNKIDLVEDFDLEKWDAYLRQQLPQLDHAPVAFLSAKEGRNVHAAIRILFDLQKQAQMKFATPKLNEVLQIARDKLLPQGRGQYPKLFYGTQVGTEPIQILVFVNEPKLFRGQYERYLARVLRDSFGCTEVPIKIMFRRRDKIVLAPKGE